MAFRPSTRALGGNFRGARPSRLAALGVALAFGFASTPASAQPQGAPPASADLEEARRRHDVGRALLEANPPDYNAALAEFMRAYELLAGHPRRYLELSNIGRCHQGLGQYDRAMEYYERYLREGEVRAEDRAQVEASIAALRDILGTLRIEVDVAGAEVWVDDRQVGAAPGRVRIPAGRHVVELRAPGHAPSRREVELASRQERALSFSLERLGRAGLRPVFFWVAAGLTVATAGVGAYWGARALAERGDVDARVASADEASRFSVTDVDRQRIGGLATTADAFFIGAAALGVGATVLAFLTDWGGARASGAPRASLLVVPQAPGVQLAGTF